MFEVRAKTPGAMCQLLVLAGFIALCLAVGALGGAVTSTSVQGWYLSLRKPAFNPPDWVFAPVWTALYLTMAIAAWQAWRRVGMARSRLWLFLLQLALNLGWSVVFFGLRSPGAALIEICLLLAAVLRTLVAFWRADMWAGLLLVPYAAWTGFAFVLNLAIWRLN